MRAKKSLGQNFLISKRIVEKIVSSADLKTNDTVLEIGPGKGVLTSVLLETGAHVIAVEKDDLLVPLLEKKFQTQIRSGQLSLIRGDVLELDVKKVTGGQYKLVANIPYYITGEILRRFLSGDNKPCTIVLMVQDEVARRIKDKKESILSLSVKVYGDVSVVCKVSRGNFYPIPNVDSAVIKIENIKNPFTDKSEEEKFFKIVKTGFAHKRKFLISNLGNLFEKNKLETIFDDLGINKKSRPEEINLTVWKSLMGKL